MKRKSLIETVPPEAGGIVPEPGAHVGTVPASILRIYTSVGAADFSATTAAY